MIKPWKELQFIKTVVIKPEDPKNPMWVQFTDDAEYEFSDLISPLRVMSRDRSIKLGANAMYTVEMDYPEDFKKLVALTGDLTEAYNIYKGMQRKLQDNWADYVQESVW